MIAGLGRLGGGDFAVGMERALAADRCDHDRRVVFHAKNVGAHVDLADVDQPARAKLKFEEALAVGAQRHLVIDA